MSGEVEAEELKRFRKAIRFAAESLQCVRASERMPIRSTMLLFKERGERKDELVSSD